MTISWDDLKNSRAGQTAIIIGNGPSLKQVDNDRLCSFTTFGANRIYLRYTPSYLTCVNPLVLEQFSKEMALVESHVKFIRSEFAHTIPGALPLHSTGLPVFSREPASQIYEGFTVTFVSMQLAYFMGYSTVLLVGVDHRYQFQGKPNEEKIMEGNDPNHFDSSYFKGMKWNNPDLVRSEQSYHMAKTIFEADGRRIINLGPDSACDIFERGKLEDWL